MEKDSLHRNLDLDHTEARIVRCPDCGQMEIWTSSEVQDHGICRCSPILTHEGTCPVCNEPWPPEPEDGGD